MSADARRAELIQAAFLVMARDGIAAGTTRAICAEAGMALATFHYCFRSRNELLRELMTMLSTSERAAAHDAMQPGVDLVESLRQAAYGYVAYLESNPGHELVLFELNHYALRTPELRDLADEQYHQYYESATYILEAAAEIASITWQVEIPILARLVVTMIDGLTTTWLVDRDTESTLSAVNLFVDHLATLATPARKRPKTAAASTSRQA